MQRRDAAALLILLAMLLFGVQPAQADPVYPSKDEVQRAQRRAAAVGSQVTRLQTQLDRAAARVEAADIALSSAAEQFDSARIDLVDSKLAAIAAAKVADRATQRLDGAQQQVGRMAAQSYRSGGSVASLGVLLSPDGPDDVLERASMMRVLAGQRQQTVQRMDAARVVATMLDQQADEAVLRQAAAAAKLAQARVEAQRRAVAARSTLAAETKARTVLLTKLAAARKTSVEVERARQSGLAEAAELLEVERERAAARQRARDRAATEAEAKDEAKPPSRPVTRRPSNPPSKPSPAKPAPAKPAPAKPAPADPGPSDPGPGDGSSSGSGSAGQSAVAWAKQQVGLPYQWGGSGPGSYDCSGLTMRAWQRAGVQLPHSSRIQYSQVEKISQSQMRPGDLLFYATDTANQETIHHVSMYIGGGQVIEAPYTGAKIRITALRRSDVMRYAGRP